MLQVRNLSVSYGAKKAVDRLSLRLKPGEALGLLGANGAGKSSAITGMLGVQHSQYDELTVFGKSPIHHRRNVFEAVGVQFQETNFPDRLTVQEACRQWAALYRETADLEELLHSFGLAGRERQVVNSLSGGERQRLAVLLALIHKPKLVFLDELTTGLDTKARKALWNRLLLMKANGLGMVLTSHYMDEVEILCDRVVILRQGRTVFQGTVTDAMRRSGKTSFEDAYLKFSGEKEEDWNAIINHSS